MQDFISHTSATRNEEKSAGNSKGLLMFGLETLDIMIGLATIYLVFGMACTAIVEAIMVWLNIRSSNLEDALKEFLEGDLSDGKKFVDEFYAHPLIQSLSKGANGRPSYIPAEIVSQVIEGLIITNSSATGIGDAITSLPADSRIKGILDALYKQTSDDVKEFRKAIENHFDNIMDRASGWVKRRSHNITLMVSIVLVLGANLDAVSLTNSLAANPEARLKIVEIAEQHLNETKEKMPISNATDDEMKAKINSAKLAFTEAASNLESAGVQLGWKDYPKTGGSLLTKIAGLLISIFAVSLGAPFWFDILQKFMQVRATGSSPRDSEKK